MKKTVKALLAAVMIVSLLVLGGCAAKQEDRAVGAEITETAVPETGAAEKKDLPKESRVGFYLDTVVTLTAYTDRPELLESALDECARYERMLSRTVEGSEVWKINHAEGETVTVSPETADICSSRPA